MADAVKGLPNEVESTAKLKESTISPLMVQPVEPSEM
jgi:hypothetical protein